MKCNESCITCLDIYCPWKGRRLDKETRADWEEQHGLLKEFNSVKELIKDLHQG